MIIEGLLPEGAKCRSSLECAGSMRCRGVGPTTAGTCGPPLAVGELCGGARVERKCVARPIPTREGEACPGGVCGGGLQCILRRCTSRKAGGEECTNDFECRRGCVKTAGSAKGKCGPRCDIR